MQQSVFGAAAGEGLGSTGHPVRQKTTLILNLWSLFAYEFMSGGR